MLCDPPFYVRHFGGGSCHFDCVVVDAGQLASSPFAELQEPLLNGISAARGTDSQRNVMVAPGSGDVRLVVLARHEDEEEAVEVEGLQA